MSVYDMNNTKRMRTADECRHYNSFRDLSADLPHITENEPLNRPDSSPFGMIRHALRNIKTDSDTLLIAALLWLLYKEGADIKLLLALAYIIL